MNRILKATKFVNNNIIAVRKCTASANPVSNHCSPPTSSTKDVPGLSKNMVNVPQHEVGFPAASKKGTYKNPEYFCYHSASYFEAEVEMMKYRLPQPSSKKKSRFKKN